MRNILWSFALVWGALGGCSGSSPEETLVNEVHRVSGSQPRNVEVMVVLGDGTCISCSKHLAQQLSRYKQEPGITIVNFASTAVLDVSQFVGSPAYMDGDALEVSDPDIRFKSRIMLVRSGVVERNIEVRAQDIDSIEAQLSQLLKEVTPVQ